MEWSKLKNIILIILAITNLCLLVFVVNRELQDSSQQRQARQDAIQMLEGRGIQVEEDQIPHQTVLLPQVVERDLEEEGALAIQLLGGDVQVEAPGGGVYRYFNDKGSVQFHSDGAFSGTFSSGTFPVGEEPVRTCLDVLERMGFQGEIIGEETDELTFRQLWEGVPLFNQQVTLVLEDGYVTAMTAGRRLVGEPAEDPGRSTITVATALIQFLNGVDGLGDVCSRVDTITRGYVSSTALSGPMTLTPVWNIVTDTGAYQLDMVTGVLSRVT